MMKRVRVRRAKKEKQETKSPKFHPQNGIRKRISHERTVNVHDASQIHLKKKEFYR